MANGYTNRLTISGDKQAVEACAEAIADPSDSDRPVAFDRIVAQEEDLRGDELWAWRGANWGVPHMPAVASVEHEILGVAAPDGERVYFFSSDGDAPLPLVVSLAAQHPELDFELVYHEPGDQTAGFARFRAGRPVEAQRLHGYDDCRALLAGVWPDELEFWQ